MTKGTLHRSLRLARAAALTMLIALGAALADPLAIGVIVPQAEGGSVHRAAVAEAAFMGATMAEEEHIFNAEIHGIDFAVEVARADGADAVTNAARSLLDDHGIVAVAGGFDRAEAEALGAFAAEVGIPYFNIGAEADALRHELCQPTTFHVAPSAAMYLDSLLGWYVRSAFRDWFLLLGEGLDAEATASRARWSMQNRHFAAGEAGSATLARGDDLSRVVDSIRRSRADVILLLMDAEHQLEVLEGLEAAGIELPVAGLPTMDTQTRAYFQRASSVAPSLGAGHRAVAWEATLDAYGAREINARFRGVYGVPMESAAWATYQAVKMVFEAATLGGASDAGAILEFLTGPEGVFDVWKGIGVTFRPWDHQLRQSLFLVRIRSDVDDPFHGADLVGELPAIYMPGTDPEERLDQLGDLAPRSRCRF